MGKLDVTGGAAAEGEEQEHASGSESEYSAEAITKAVFALDAEERGVEELPAGRDFAGGSAEGARSQETEEEREAREAAEAETDEERKAREEEEAEAAKETETDEEREAREQAEADAEAEAEAKKKAEEEEDETKGWSERARSRFNELTKRAKTAEERQQELESTVAELTEKLEAGGQGTTPAPTADNPLAGYTDERKLGQLEAEARQLRAKLIRNPEGWEYKDDKGNVVEVTSEQVRETLINVTEDLEMHIPQRRQYLAQEREYSQQAQQFFPELKDSGSEFRQKADAVVAALPAVKNLPGWRFAVGYYASGQTLAEVAGAKTPEILKALKEGKSVDAILGREAKPKAKKEKEARPAPRAPRAPSGVVPGKVGADRAASSRKRLIEAAQSGDEEAEVAAFEQMLTPSRG